MSLGVGPPRLGFANSFWSDDGKPDLVAIVASVLVWNAAPGATTWWIGISIWGGASVLLGAVTGRLSFFLWAFSAIPIAYPFGVGDGFRYSEPLPLWFGAAVVSLPAALLILAAAAGRKALDGRSCDGDTDHRSASGSS